MSYTSLRAVRNLYAYRRFWYHISTTLKRKTEHLIPWDSQKGFNRPDDEPEGKRICVAPTIEQCLTAIPYFFSDTFAIYRTEKQVIANQPLNVFDAEITHEGWIQSPTTFVKMGKLNLEDVERGLEIEHVIEEAASEGHKHASKKVLRWWQNVKVHRFIKPTKST